MKVTKLPRRNSKAYKSLVGSIIGTYSLANRIERARAPHRIAKLCQVGKRQVKKIESTYSLRAFPRLHQAVIRLNSVMYS